MNGENTEVVVKDGENAAEIKVNAKDTSASVEAASDAVTVTVGEKTEVKKWYFCYHSNQLQSGSFTKNQR